MLEYKFTLTRDQLEDVRKKLAARNIKIVGDEGDVSKFGVDVHFKFAEPYLEVTVPHKPFYISDETVTNTVTNWFKQETV